MGDGVERNGPVAGEGLTDTQERVLDALCRPLRDGGPYASPATNREIAAEVFLSVDAVKGHLRVLYAKAGLQDLPQNRKRARLAEAWLNRGLEQSPPRPRPPEPSSRRWRLGPPALPPRLLAAGLVSAALLLLGVLAVAGAVPGIREHRSADAAGAGATAPSSPRQSSRGEVPVESGERPLQPNGPLGPRGGGFVDLAPSALDDSAALTTSGLPRGGAQHDRGLPDEAPARRRRTRRRPDGPERGRRPRSPHEKAPRGRSGEPPAAPVGSSDPPEPPPAAPVRCVKRRVVTLHPHPTERRERRPHTHVRHDRRVELHPHVRDHLHEEAHVHHRRPSRGGDWTHIHRWIHRHVRNHRHLSRVRVEKLHVHVKRVQGVSRHRHVRVVERCT